ncbi:MAG: hypothetical protein ACLTPG_04810 [Mediterraneibacter gnavus]
MPIRPVELERDKTVQDLQSQIAGLAVAAAGKVLGEGRCSRARITGHCMSSFWLKAVVAMTQTANNYATVLLELGVTKRSCGMRQKRFFL